MDISSTSLTTLFMMWAYRQDMKNENWIYIKAKIYQELLVNK